MKIGIIGAMQEEVDSLLRLVKSPTTQQFGGRTFTLGQYLNNDVVIVYSRVGKVSSASTATTLIQQFGVDIVLFTGIAGAVAPELNVGDIVIGDKCIQHDMDASPIFPKYEIPLTNTTYFHSCENLVEKAFEAAQLFLKEDFNTVISDAIQKKFGIHQPNIKIGTIASGDQFISCPLKISQFKQDIPHLLAVEMEGAAVSQVCAEYDIPFVVIRTISDKANADAPTNFNSFLSEVATLYAIGIIKQLLSLLNTD